METYSSWSLWNKEERREAKMISKKKGAIKKKRS
jgi:hypothetical protein